MAMSIANAAYILKTRYLGTVREQLNNATVLLQKIGRKDQMVSGTNFTVALHSGRNNSAGTGIADGGTLPTAGQQSYMTTVVPNRYLYGRIEVTGPVIAATRDNVGAFVEALNSEVDGLMRDFKRDFNRQLHGNGSGALAYCAAVWASTATTGTVDDNLGNAFVHLPTTAITLDVVEATGTTAVAVDNVTSSIAIGTTTYTLTLGAQVTGTNALADGDFWVKSAPTSRTVDTAYTSPEVMGIAGIISDGNTLPCVNATGLQGLAVASYPWWKAQVVGSGATKKALDFTDMQQVIDAIATNSDYSDSDISFMMSNYPVRRAYYDLCIQQRRHVNTMELDGGWKAVEFNGIPWVVDNQCQRNTIWFINTDTLAIYRTSDFDWMDKDGSYLSRVANKDAYEGVLFHYGNLACLSRNGNGALLGVAEV